MRQGPSARRLIFAKTRRLLCGLLKLRSGGQSQPTAELPGGVDAWTAPRPRSNPDPQGSDLMRATAAMRAAEQIVG